MNKIGIIDSGKGGINCFPPGTPYMQMPGDYRPYGNMADGQLEWELSRHLHYLDSYGIKDKYIACYTLATYVRRTRRKLPPNCYSILDLAESYTFDAVICTPSSSKYFSYYSVPQPRLAECIETGQGISLTNANLKGMRVLAGCTHYYDIADQIKAYYQMKELICPQWDTL